MKIKERIAKLDETIIKKNTAIKANKNTLNIRKGRGYQVLTSDQRCKNNIKFKF